MFECPECGAYVSKKWAKAYGCARHGVAACRDCSTAEEVEKGACVPDCGGCR